MKIIESDKYKQQLRIIALNIKKDKPSASIKFVKDLKNTIKNIPNMPYKYRKSYYFNSESIRDMVFNGYTIVYEIFDNIIEIQMIFNQNLPTINTKEP